MRYFRSPLLSLVIILGLAIPVAPAVAGGGTCVMDCQPPGPIVAPKGFYQAYYDQFKLTRRICRTENAGKAAPKLYDRFFVNKTRLDRRLTKKGLSASPFKDDYTVHGFKSKKGRVLRNGCHGVS